jgi:hypothetical protein
MPASGQMKSIFLAVGPSLLESRLSGETGSVSSIIADSTSGHPLPPLSLGVNTRSHTALGIVDPGGDAMSAVAFHRCAAAAESREDYQAAKNQENVSHMQFLYSLIRKRER